LAYALEHVECRDPGGLLVFFHPVSAVRVYLWDSSGRLVAEETAWEKEFLPTPFRTGWFRLHAAEATVAAPAEARCVAVSLGHDVTTNLVPIPPATP
jgi:hypothetical protein